MGAETDATGLPLKEAALAAVRFLYLMVERLAYLCRMSLLLPSNSTGTEVIKEDEDKYLVDQIGKNLHAWLGKHVSPDTRGMGCAAMHSLFIWQSWVAWQVCKGA